MIVYGKCECFVMQMLYVGVLCASCGSSQFCVLHDLQFVNAGRGCFVQAKTFCRYGCIYFLAALVLVCVDVMVMSYA